VGLRIFGASRLTGGSVIDFLGWGVVSGWGYIGDGKNRKHGAFWGDLGGRERGFLPLPTTKTGLSWFKRKIKEVK